MVITHFNLHTNICFYKYGHNSGPRGSPDMILSAVHVKFDKKKDEIPPRACRPLKKIPKSQNKNAPGNGSPARPSARAGGPGGAAPREE